MVLPVLRDRARQRTTASTSGVVGRQGGQREFLDLHGRAGRGEERRDGVLSVAHAVPGAATEMVSAAQSTSSVTAFEDRGDVAAAEGFINLLDGL